MTESIFHITSRSAWQAAQSSGSYMPESLSSQGFIHCSSSEQVNRVANAFFAGVSDLVLLEIDPQKLESSLRWEPGEDRPEELFPHIYGPLNLEAVSQVIDFSLGTSGSQ